MHFNNNGLKFFIEQVILVVAAGLLPLVYFSHLISRNVDYFYATNCIFAGVILSFLGICLYFLIACILDNRISIIICIIWWVVFWGYSSISKFSSFAFGILLIPIGMVIIGIRMKVFNEMAKYVVSVFAIIIVSLWLIIFIFNSQTAMIFLGILYWLFIFLSLIFGISIIIHIKIDYFVSVTLSTVIIALGLYNVVLTKNMYSNNKDLRDESNFVINEICEHPDIYWLHMDGMMSFDEISTLYEDDQQALRDKLENYGFLINEDAKLNVGFTSFALPALTSPNLYDTIIKSLFEDMDGLIPTERVEILRDTSKLNFVYDYFDSLELFDSFEKIGYDCYYLVPHTGRGVELVPDSFRYDESFGNRDDKIFIFFIDHSILSVFKQTLMGFYEAAFNNNITLKDDYNKSIFKYVNRKSNINDPADGTIEHYDWYIADSFQTILEKDSPKLFYIQNLIPHCPFVIDENGIETSTEYGRYVSSYLPQHKYAAQIMMGMVDRIIDKDPDAVIVIQGDHGIHGFTRKELNDQGFDDSELDGIAYSTISAVRIPEKYGTLSEPIDPLDITRYLVNHFVGEGNYVYLYYKED